MPRRATRDQIANAVTGFAWTFTLSLGAFYAIDRVMGMRASEREQSLGLDVSEQEVVGYPDFAPTLTDTMVFGTTPAEPASLAGETPLPNLAPGGD